MAAFVPTAASGPRPPRSHPVGGTPRPAMLARSATTDPGGGLT
jgi:hypothetical protein